MAAAREETTIDLDEPESPEDKYALAPPITAPLHDKLNDFVHQHFYQGEIAVPKDEAALDRDRQFTQRVGEAIRPAYSLWWPGAIANHFQEKRAQEADQEERMRSLSDKEKLLLKAKENAQKIAAAKAQQEKAIADRDQAVAEGHNGYRVERPLFGLPR